MRLLPRTSRGTWLLALVAWLIASAATWLSLPFVPRVEWALPYSAAPVAYLPGHVIVTADTGDLSRARHDRGWASVGPLRLWDADSGQSLRSVTLPAGCHVRRVQPSRTGRWLALLGRPVDDVSLWLLDLTTDHVIRPTTVADVTDCRFGPDDQWLLCAADGGVHRLALPELIADLVLKRNGTILAHEIALAPDGRAAAIRAADEPIIRVWRDTSSSESMIPLPAGWFLCGLGLSDAGTVLAGYEAMPAPPGSGVWSIEARCWDTATGRELLGGGDGDRPIGAGAGGRLVPQLASLSADGRTFTLLTTAPAPPRNRLTIWDVPAGTLRAEVDLPDAGGNLAALRCLAPDGRSYVAEDKHPSFAARIKPWTRRLGMTWPTITPIGDGAVVFDTADGASLGRITGGLADALWAPDGSRLVTFDPAEFTIRVWEMPPRKSLVWFGSIVGVAGLVIAWLARRRTRRLAACPG